MDGILPVWKDEGMTSYDVIRIFKQNVMKTLPAKTKIGHAGTLDPFAEGVLLLLLGKATKRMEELQHLPKTYVATSILGAYSDTLDKTGHITQVDMDGSRTLPEITAAAQKFTGEIDQKIPDYSAAKVLGQPRYKLARRGETLPAKSKKITVYHLEILDFKKFADPVSPADESNHRTEVTLRVTCSSGTYVRQLAYDIFKSMGIESYLETLVREKIGSIDRETCITTGQLADVHTVSTRVLPCDGAFGTQPA